MIPSDRFTNRVDAYVKARPGYPEEIVAILTSQAGLAAGGTIADVGAGTGIASELFLRHGFRVIAVEPNDTMRAAASARLGERPGYRAVAGRAESTTLPPSSVDAVVAAQAFHWFDRAAFRDEASRILRPGGPVVLMWNVRRVDASAFDAEYEALIREFATDYLTVRHENVSEEDLASFFGGPLVRRVLDNPHAQDLGGLRGRLLSSSYVPAEGQPRASEMIAALEALFEKHRADGRVIMNYETRVYAGSLSATR